jgi:hypothetical protein
MRGARNATLTRLDDIRNAIVVVFVKKLLMRHLLGDSQSLGSYRYGLFLAEVGGVAGAL